MSISFDHLCAGCQHELDVEATVTKWGVTFDVKPCPTCNDTLRAEAFEEGAEHEREYQ